MFPLNCVLCPVDLSDHSKCALAIAAALAKNDGARLVIASFVEPLLSDVAATRLDLDSINRDIEAQVRAAAGSVIPDFSTWRTPPAVVVRRGEPHEAIIAAAAQEHADLIVMGTHGLRGAAKLVLGSVTQRVIRKSPAPVLAVPFRAGEAGSAGTTGDFTVQRVIGAIDLTTTTDQVVAIAVEIAQKYDAELRLVHVVDADPHDDVTRDAHIRIGRTRAAQRLDDLARRISQGRPVATRVITGKPADELAVDAAETQASLIVMGLSSGGMFADRAGSVAYRVTCLAAVPVLVLPPQPTIASSGA